jgi:hypothetical protein
MDCTNFMNRTIAIDDTTYGTIKALAKKEDRTIAAELRYIVKNYGNVPASSAPTVSNADFDLKRQRIEELTKELAEYDEDSDEYQDILDEIRMIQSS